MGSLCEVDLMQKTSTAEISVWFANAPRKHADPVETCTGKWETRASFCLWGCW